MISETIPTPRTSGADERFQPVIEILKKAVIDGVFPGCSFGVLSEDGLIIGDAVGRFTYEESSPVVETQTIFDVASITKVVATTAAAMLLYQRGQLHLETPLAELLPGFVVGRPHGTFARHIKVRHLLAHSSGLPGYVEFFRTCRTPDSLLRACLELPVATPPGSHAEYSDPGFILLGKAIEVIVREPLDRWVQREIFSPVGMTATGFHPPAHLRTSIPPTEADTTFRHRVIQGEVQDENASVLNGTAGHAGVFSNVHDLLLFSREVLRSVAPSQEDKPCLFERNTVELFSERQPPDGSSRALGWDTPSPNSSAGRLFSTKSIGHLGYSGCSLWIDLEAHVAIALLTNRTWPDRKSQGIREVRPMFHDAIRAALG